jgi:hypothetical protein
MSNFEDKDSRNNGRWTKMEHEKFLLGIDLINCRSLTLREKLEENLITSRNQNRSTNTFSCSKILPQIKMSK